MEIDKLGVEMNNVPSYVFRQLCISVDSLVDGSSVGACISVCGLTVGGGGLRGVVCMLLMYGSDEFSHIRGCCFLCVFFQDITRKSFLMLFHP